MSCCGTQERKAAEEKRRRTSFFFIPSYAECRSAALLAAIPPLVPRAAQPAGVSCTNDQPFISPACDLWIAVLVGRSTVSWLRARLWPLAGGRREEGQRETDRRACLIHESPAEVLWGFWLHCPFNAKRRGPPPSSEEDLSNVGKWVSAFLPPG
ncbi:hypothetical protein QQF64_026716 [Cirrhinus molitorella]|uniref:Uncharacterized protein n=1 Tax=Cirrhinus molitorella TaxID=172907 RepID=A0ABR3NAE1_9TELE